MLLRFGAENCQSVREYQEVSLVASTLRDDGPFLLASSDFSEKVVPAAILYGANASGKTTMLTALSRLVNFVENSHVKGGPNKPIPIYEPFALSPDHKQKPLRLDCDFIVEGIRYHFGFEVTEKRVTAEWLYAFSGNYKTLWYERGQSKDNIRFGRTLRGRNRAIQDLTRDNSLFISAAAQNSHEQLTSIFTYLTKKIKVRIEYGPALGLGVAKNGKIDPRVIDFLKFADTGIVDAKVEEANPTPESKKFAEELSRIIKDNLISDDFSLDVKVEELSRSLKLGHQSIDGQVVFFSMQDESRGTAKLVDLLTDVYETIDSGGVILIDELDNSLHTLLARQLVSLFNSPDTNPNGAQLVATTHDTNLMQQSLFRRDQIWLCEKDPSGASCVYPLTDIAVRRSDNVEKGYLQGRFGAIPLLGVDRRLVEIGIEDAA